MTETSSPASAPSGSTLPRLALSVPNMAEPATLVELGVRAERSGWDGVFLWDHVHGSRAMPVPVADPWVVLGALAVRTERILLGTGVTPVARRRPQKLARETVTVDRLSQGRMVLGVGLGEPPEEYIAYGEIADRPTVAARLDEALDVLVGLWSGRPFSHEGPHYTVEDAQFLPTPLRRPRIPIWTACIVPHTRPLRRAARWDGVMLGAFENGSIDAVPLAELRRAVETIAEQRSPDSGPFEVAVSHPDLPTDAERADYADAGATWVMVTGWLDHLVELAATPVT